MSDFGIEVLAAIVGSVVVISVTAIMLRFQSQQEQERDHFSKLFQLKLKMYKELLEIVFKVDDDGIISMEEVQNIENKVGVVCLVASEKLVSQFSQFVYQLKVYGALYYQTIDNDTNSARKDNFRNLVHQELAKDTKRSILTWSKHDLKWRGQDIDAHLEEYFLSLDELLQGMREDLAVVEGDIEQNVEQFVQIEYDKYKFIPNPNAIDV